MVCYRWMGHVLSELGDYHKARIAFKKMLECESSQRVHSFSDEIALAIFMAATITKSMIMDTLHSVR